ncbi:hypothetical protein, partial [Microbacterium flavum]|uniref:hypothetical protein n=1 Tax=Microbacterium flavum TaxID=415216 RepID=UPI0031CE6635
PQKPPANNATQTSPSSLAPDLKRIAGALEAEARKPPSDYERRNVEAQEMVAAWTPWIAIVATLEMFITAAGVILVGFTLYHTKRAADASRDAADEAKRASNAAEKSIKVARDVGRAQVRAYLGFDVISGDIAPGRPIKFHVRATNHGQSPAIDVAIASCVVVRQLNWEWEDEEKIPEGQFPRITIHPNGFYDTFP